MLLQPRSIRLPDGYNSLDEPIAGTEKLIARWPRWFAEFGITPELMLHLTHAEHERCSLPFSERRRMRWSFNGKELDHNQRRRFWDELIKWQALLIKQLASRNQRNVYYRESLKHQTVYTVNNGKLVRLDQHRADVEAAWEPPCDAAKPSAA